MKRIAVVLVRQRWLVITLPFLLGAVLVVGPERGGSIVVAGIWGAVVVVAASVLALNLAGFDPGGAQVVTDVDATPLGRALLVRWLSRSRYGRFVGGSAGLILGVGLGDGDLGPALVGLLAGVAVGGAAVELHLVARRRTTRRTADLAVRHVVDYVPALDRVASGVLAVAAAGVVVAATMAGGPGAGLAVRLAVGALVAVVAMIGVQRAVVGRRRPALEPGLRSADDLVRSLAVAQGFTRPAIALAAALVGEALFAEGWGGASLVLWALALGWYAASWRTRSGILGRQAALG